MRIAEDRWLAERFGHPVFSVSAEVDAPGAEAILEHACEREAASYQARIPAERPGDAAALTAVGFEVINVAITLAREPGVVDDGADPVVVRPAEPQVDRAAVTGIAERAFTRSRFHLDPSIPPGVANRIKRDWADNALTGGRGDGMLVVLSEGEPVGFLAGLHADVDGRRARVIDLIGVDAAARGHGAGRALVKRFLGEARSGFDEVRAGTQAANPGGSRFYERLGFLIAEAAYDLHLHTGDVWADG